MKISKITTYSTNGNCKNTQNNTVYTLQELHLQLLSFSARVILANFTSSTVSVHSSIIWSTNSVLHLQFSQSKYSPTSHALSHSHSKLLGFQINHLHILLYQLVLYIHICIYIYSNVVYYYKHLPQIYTNIYKFHAIL